MVSTVSKRYMAAIAALGMIGCLHPAGSRAELLNGSFADFNVTSQAPPGIYGTLSQNNVLGASAYGQKDTLSLTPTGFVKTDINDNWNLDFVNGTINFSVAAHTGSSIERLTMDASGSYQLLMSQFDSNTKAYAASTMELMLRITGINGTSPSRSDLPWLRFNKGSDTPDGLLITNPNGFLHEGTASGILEQSWFASFNRSIRGAGGLADLSGLLLESTDFVTEISLSLTTSLGAESVVAAATSKLNSADIGVVSQAQPVPEPPTIILAGLGAVAVVANGYRRKKQRRDAEAEMPLDAMEETGAIALTA